MKFRILLAAVLAFALLAAPAPAEETDPHLAEIASLKAQVGKEHRRGNHYKRKFRTEQKNHRKHHASKGRTAVASVYSIATNGGTTTASGQPLSDSKATFAHKSMRFGTKVRFTYKGRSVVAKCTDRGPYVAGRTFDLSTKTQRSLGFPWGVARVTWRVVK